MSSREWRRRVANILASIAAIQQRSRSLSFADFAADRVRLESILYQFIVIGEATRSIPAEIQACAPEVPWRLMGDMRNVIVHEYFQLQLETIWYTIQAELPALREPLERLLAESESL